MAGKQSEAVAKAQRYFMKLRGKGLRCNEINLAEVAKMFGISRSTFCKAQWYKDEVELDRKEGK